MSANATKPQPFDVDAASLSMTPEQFAAAYESARAAGSEIYASPITFKRLYGDEADAKIESFKSRKNHKLVAKRGVSPKDIDRQHEEYLKAGYNLEYDVSDLSDDPVEVGRNLKQMVGTGYGARIDLAQVKQAYGDDWVNQANKALRHGINLYERMKFEDAVRLVPAAEVAAPDKMASAHGKEPGPLGSDEMAPAHPIRNPERMLYVAVNVPDASQGRGTARLYFSAKLAKDREQEWSEITGKRSDVFLLPAKLFPDDAKVKVGAAEVARDKWIEMDNRDMPPEMRPWEQAKHRFTIDGRSRQSHDTKGQLDWNTEEGQKNIKAALDSYQTNVLDKTFLIGGATVAALTAARDTLGLLSASAKSDRQALGQLREYEAKDATGLIRMGTALGAMGLASVERFAGSMRNIGQMFIDLGHPDQVRLIHDAAMRYAKQDQDMPLPFLGGMNPFAAFLRRIREKAVENAKGGKVSLWDAVTDVAEEDFAPLMKVANAAITVPFFKAIAGFEAFDAFVYAFGKGIEQGAGEEVVPVVEELPRDVPYGQRGVEYELDYARQVGLKMLSAPAATVFSTGNYMYRMLRAAGFKEGFAAEAEAIAAIVGMHLAGKHVKQAVITAGAQIRDWAALKLAEGRWERTAREPEVVAAARDWARDVMKIETADQMDPGELADTVTKKQKMQVEAIEEQKKKEAQEAFDAIAKAEEAAKPEPEVPVAEEVREDAGRVQEPGVEQAGQAEGGQNIPGDQEAGRGEPAPGAEAAAPEKSVAPKAETVTPEVNEKPVEPPAPVAPKEEIVTPEPVGTPLEEVQRPVRRAPVEQKPAAGDANSGPTMWIYDKLGLTEFERSNSYWVKREDLTYAPDLMQFRSDVDAEGVTGTLKDVKRYSTTLAGPVHVWRDPASGKLYIINGHHRYERALKLGQNDLEVTEVRGLKNVKEASLAGALINIGQAQQNVKAADVARLFRSYFGDADADGRLTEVAAKRLREICEESGLSMRSKAVKDGIKLARLDESIFKDYRNLDITEEAATTISDVFPEDATRQRFLYRLVRDRMTKKKTDEYPTRYEIESLANQIANNNVRIKKKRTLLGEEEVLEWEVDPNIKTDLETMVRGRLTTTFKDAGRISNDQNAKIMELLGEDPNTIPTDKANELRTVVGAVREIFNRAVKNKGEIDDLIRRYTNEIADDARETDGKNKHKLEEKFYRETVEALQRAYGGGEGKNVRLFSDDLEAGEPGEAGPKVDPNQKSLFSRQIPGEGADRPTNSLAARTPVELTEPVVPEAPTAAQLPEVFKLMKVMVRSLWPDLAMSRFLKFAEKLPGDAFGMFKQQYRRGERATSTITLKSELLEAITSLTRTAAHELGHFLQYFIREKPQLDPKDKGGAEDMLLDVAGKFELPGGKAPWDDPGRYPDADLAELKGAAESMRTENNNFGNVYQDFRSWEVPFRKRNAFKNLPDEIKKFWQEISPEDRVETYNAVLRGVDAPYFDLARMRTERPAADAVFERMMLDQINRLYELRQSPLYQELKDVARTFTPFDETADAEVTAYRYSPSELWAEFVSAILTAPSLVKRTAPRLTLEWMEWANQQKPEFYDWWAKFSGFTEGDGAAFKSRMLDVGEGYDLSQDAKRFQTLMKFDEKGRGHMGPLANAAKLFVDRNEFIWQKLKKQYLLDRVDPNKSPMVALAPIEHYVKAMSYLDAHAAPYIYHLFNKIHRTFSDAWVNDKVSLSLKELHEFMFLKRTSEEKYYKKVTKEDPETGETTTATVEKQIPQSGLLQPKFAKSTLDYFKEQIGEKKSAYYEDLFTSWQALRQKYVIPAMERSEAWADDHPYLQKARTNAVYGKFSSLDVIMEAIKMYGTDVGGEMFGGATNLASMLHGRKGNVGGVADIPSETFEQDIQILRMARRMELRRKYVEEMYKYAPDMLQAGSARYPDWRKLTITKGGEKIDIWMDPRFHEAMVRPDVTMSGMERLLELINYPYKNAFVKYHLAFSVFNTVRDYNSSVLKLPQARRFVDLPWGIIQMLPEGLREMAMEKTGIRFNRSLARYFLPAAEKALRETKYLEGEKVEYPIELEDMQMEGLVSSGNSWNSMIGIADLGNELNYLYRSIKDKVKFTAELLKINSGQKTLASSDVPEALKEHLLKTESLERDFQKFNLKLQNDPAKYHQEVSQPINNLIVGVAKDVGNFFKTAFQTIPKIARMSDRINKIVGYEYLMEHAGDIWRDVTPAEREALIYNAVRERAGSPDFRTKGLAYAFYNNLFLFSNAGIQGVNSLYSAFKDNPYSTAWKMAMYNVGPKILMYYLYQGAIPFEFTEPVSGTKFDQDDLKKVLQKVPNYVLARYRVIPIAVYGMGADQELFYATLPSSFEGESIGMLTWAGLEAGAMEWAGAPGTGNVSNVVKTLDAIQPFASEAPALKTVKNFAEYFGYNINPYNPYTGKGVIPHQEFMDSRVALQKGGLHTLRWAYTSRWIAYDMLNSLLGGFVYRPSDMVELAADKITGDPADKLKWDMMTSFKRFGVAVGPAFGRIFRSTNAGEKRLVVENSIREENENFVKRQESRREIDAKLDGLPKMKGRYPRITAGFIKATAAELKRKDAAYKDPDDLKEYLRRKMWAESGVPILMDVARARSTKGVVARLKKIHPDTTERNYKAKLNKIEREVFGYDLP